MTRQRSLRRPLILALGGLLLLSAAPHEAYSQESVKAGRRAPVEVPQSLRQPPKSKSATDDPFPDPSVHGFFMLGKDNVMLYHSSAFNSSDHPYQMIMKASLAPTEEEAFYRDNYQTNIDAGYTWISHNAEWEHGDETAVSEDPFTLPNIHAGSVNNFDGEISLLATDGGGYPQGHDYLSNVEFTVERIMYFRHYDLSADYPEELTYLLFGIGTEVYMAHYLTKRGDGETPDPLAFDDVVRIKRPVWLEGEDDLLESVIEVKILGLSVIDSLPSSSPLVLGESLTATVYGDTSISGQKFTVDVLEELWFDTEIINQ